MKKKTHCLQEQRISRRSWKEIFLFLLLLFVCFSCQLLFTRPKMVAANAIHQHWWRRKDSLVRLWFPAAAMRQSTLDTGDKCCWNSNHYGIDDCAKLIAWPHNCHKRNSSLKLWGSLLCQTFVFVWKGTRIFCQLGFLVCSSENVADGT